MDFVALLFFDLPSQTGRYLEIPRSEEKEPFQFRIAHEKRKTITPSTV